MRSPITRYGGKYYMLNSLKPLVNTEHLTYVEVFGGAAHLFFAKEVSEIEVYNDLDRGLVNFFRVLRENGEELHKKLQLTPYSRSEFYYCMNNWRTESDSIEKARMYWVSIMQSFGGVGVSFGASIAVARRGMSQVVSKYLRYIDERIPEAIERLRSVQIEDLDFEECIKKYDRETTLFYLDPPYLPEKRTTGGYEEDMEYEDHVRLINLINNCKGKFLLSGYSNDLYDSKLINFKKLNIKEVKTRVDGSPKSSREKRFECVWLNY